ncbi:hypothetical protein OIU77_022824 [Salix suchowensis]|uniref:Uncharacterized protein n=1 Tax=Salix suchowensis TaxID=1278906 RepID=A0ABQ9C643_9ROSI|nr:hypothetical protein OIU77_022824 [Salix suchowensis]
MKIEEAKEKKEIEREEMEMEMEVETQDESEGLRRPQPWTQQITGRGFIASILIGAIYSVIVMKLNLTTGLAPNFNVSAALLAFVFVRSWTKMLQKAGFVVKPFTRQENTMIQTCAVACYSLAHGGGFASYLLGLNRKTYELSGVNTEGNSSNSVKEPGFGWMCGYLFLVCFVGLFVLIPLRKILIVDMNLTFPSGMATAVLINGFHSKGNKTAKFFFDFNTTFIGAGMLVSHLVNLSLLLGSVLSYGVMWPLIGQLKGNWFPASLEETSMKSLYGYKVFLAVALILGDGLYTFVKVMFCTIINVHGRLRNKKLGPAVDHQKKHLDDQRVNDMFLRETIPFWRELARNIMYVSEKLLSEYTTKIGLE